MRHFLYLASILSMAAALLTSAPAMSREHSPLDAFPEAGEGMNRLVIVVPEMSRSEDNYSIELVAGRIIHTDGVNQVRMDTALNPRPLEGWGYTYYEVSGSGQVASTLMAPPEGAPQVEAFVHGAPLNIRYNSRMPIVVYAPEGFEVRYRIWAAAETFLNAGPG